MKVKAPAKTSPKGSGGFTATPEFARFKDIMRGLLAVPKAELDRMVKTAKEDSPRAGNPRAPGRRPT